MDSAVSRDLLRWSAHFRAPPKLTGLFAPRTLHFKKRGRHIARRRQSFSAGYEQANRHQQHLALTLRRPHRTHLLHQAHVALRHQVRLAEAEDHPARSDSAARGRKVGQHAGAGEGERRVGQEERLRRQRPAQVEADGSHGPRGGAAEVERELRRRRPISAEAADPMGKIGGGWVDQEKPD